jgi:hypothetical protein
MADLPHTLLHKGLYQEYIKSMWTIRPTETQAKDISRCLTKDETVCLRKNVVLHVIKL